MNPADAAKALLQRRAIRSDFRSWCEYALAPLNQKPAAHHLLLIDELQKIATGETKRLMINLPPGSAKSTYGSMLFPAWLFAKYKNIDIIGASNTASLAEGFSRRIIRFARDNEKELGYSLVRENVEDWETSNGNHYRAAGVGGTIAGKRANFVIIDDPVRSRADAESETVKESQWNWFTADLRTRLKPEARIVVIMTRWSVDDLGGRLIERQPGLWKVVRLPAIAEENDALGRKPGDFLWSDGPYGYGGELQRVHEEYMEAGADRDWSSLYQGNPVLASGNIFKTDRITYIDAAPAGMPLVRAWDLASTAATGGRDPDWTAGALIGRTALGGFVVSDVVHVRGGPDEVEATIVATASRDGKRVKVSLPQDPGQAGASQVLYLTRKLAGYNVHTSRETGDKATRAAPFAAQVNVGNVSFVKGSWNKTAINEFAAFPGGAHDDIVDACSRGFDLVHDTSAAERFGALAS